MGALSVDSLKEQPEDEVIDQRAVTKIVVWRAGPCRQPNGRSPDGAGVTRIVAY